MPGDYLTRPAFERRYHAQPDIKKAELIEGIVYMPSPVRADRHGDPHFVMIGWLGVYQAATPGVRGSDNATLRLDFLNEPQPDILLRLDPALGGRSRLGADGYLEGSPEFIVEIAASSASYDMNQKKSVLKQIFLSFQSTQHHALNKIALREKEEQDHRQHHRGGGSHEQIPARIHDTAEGSQPNRHGKVAIGAQIEQRTQEIVPRVEKSEDRDRRQRGFAQGHHNAPVDAKIATTVDPPGVG